MMSSKSKIKLVRMTGRILHCFSSILLCNLVSDFVLKLGQRLFSQSTKNSEVQKANKKTNVCLPNQQSFGLFGASCFLCQYRLFFEPPTKRYRKKVKICKKIQRISFFQQHSSCLLSLMSHSSETLRHK